MPDESTCDVLDGSYTDKDAEIVQTPIAGTITWLDLFLGVPFRYSPTTARQIVAAIIALGPLPASVAQVANAVVGRDDDATLAGVSDALNMLHKKGQVNRRQRRGVYVWFAKPETQRVKAARAKRGTSRRPSTKA